MIGVNITFILYTTIILLFIIGYIRIKTYFYYEIKFFVFSVIEDKKKLELATSRVIN